MKLTSIRPKYVQHIPESLEEGVLYISERFGICSHLCACGCKEEVITPLSQAEWHLFKDGELVSMLPSIGNWNYRCQSHYFIEQNGIRWLPRMSTQKIKRVQLKDKVDLQRMLEKKSSKYEEGSVRDAAVESSASTAHAGGGASKERTLRTLIAKLKKFFS
jgi:hypothetical protein